MAMLSKSAKGIDFICSKQYSEKIKSYLHIARVLVFQESIEQRFERAKKKFEDENTMTEEYMIETTTKLKTIIERNNIDLEVFFKTVYNHFHRRTGKKNNLFFLGPPSTGKTMIMNSILECHFNYSRLTGLISGSSFNFSGLLHTNACMMDECKLTENQFEQWKLLASALPMSTDVKYKDRCNISNCVLYTCSNYPIEMYCQVPMAREAVKTRTMQFELTKPCEWYLKIAPHVWERLWKEYNVDG